MGTRNLCPIAGTTGMRSGSSNRRTVSIRLLRASISSIGTAISIVFTAYACERRLLCPSVGKQFSPTLDSRGSRGYGIFTVTVFRETVAPSGSKVTRSVTTPFRAAGRTAAPSAISRGLSKVARMKSCVVPGLPSSVTT